LLGCLLLAAEESFDAESHFRLTVVNPHRTYFNEGAKVLLKLINVLRSDIIAIYLFEGLTRTELLSMAMPSTTDNNNVFYSLKVMATRRAFIAINNKTNDARGDDFRICWHFHLQHALKI
jgi:hypothetical protein